jgi:serine/threonine-protein kinase
VLELVEGENLEDLLTQEGKLGPLRVLEIADELLDALAAAHTFGILHRDLKPDNLLVATDGNLRVLDFGIARMETQQGAEARLTINGCVMGTPGFMAPEQAKGDWSDVDARTDLWAVGATMFTLLTGRHVHVGRSQQELMIACLTQPAPSLREVDPNLPSRLAAIVDRALAYRPDSRWASAAQMRDEVRKALEQLRGSTAEAPPTLRPLTSDSLRAPAPGSRPRRRLWPLLAAAACGMVVASGALELERRLAAQPLARGGVSTAARQIAATYAGYHAAARAWPLR